MRRAIITASLLLVALAAGAWFVSGRQAHRRDSMQQAQTAPARSRSAEQLPQTPDVGVPSSAADRVDLDKSDLPASVDSNTVSPAWPESPATMEALILQALASLPDSGIASIVSSECTRSQCEVQFVSNRMLSVLIGPDSPFAERFSGAPYGAYVHVRSRMIAPGTWERTISLRSNGFTEQRLNKEWRNDPAWRQAAVLPRQTVDALASFSSPRMTLAVGTTYEGVPVTGRNGCVDHCPGGAPSLIYLRVPAGRTCAELSGMEVAIRVSADSDGTQRQTFCLPNLIVEY